MTLEDKYEELDPNELKPNPINVTIYGEEEADLELVESIEKKGQLELLVITNDKIIISGHRRWLALKALNIPAKCRLMSFENELDEKEALIEFNRQREKKPSQIYNEVKILSSIYAERAKVRQLSALKGVANNVENEITDVLSSVQPEKDEAGRTRDLLAKVVGVKRDRLAKIIEVGKKADDGDEIAIRTMKQLDSGEITTNAANIILKLNEDAKFEDVIGETANILLSKIEKGDITANHAMRQLKSLKEERKEQKDIQAPREIKLPDGIFNVILADLPYPQEDLLRQIVPAAEDSALFLWSKPESLTKSLEVMEKWGFNYRSMAILDWGKTGNGNWFLSSHDILLLGTKGKWTAPEKENKFSVNIPSKDGCSKSDCVFEMIERMFPDQRYLPLWIETDRPGWGMR